MKKLYSVFLCLMLVLVSVFTVSVTADSQDIEIDMGELAVYTVDNMAGKYKTQGRTSIQGDLLMVDYSASGIEFEAECHGDVSVTFNAASVTSGNDGGCYFTVIVDGVAKARDFCRLTANGDTKVTVAEDLPNGKHTFAIYRQTEIERATVGIKSIELKGTLLDAPENKDLYIEFVGDSITTAYGNLALNGTANPSFPKHQDATQGYAYLTAKALDADFSLVARQGIGAQIGYQPVNMQTVYPLLRHAKDTTTQYDFARQPDYVVIALGTNDVNTYKNPTYGGSPTNGDAYLKQGFKDMAELVREKNPNAKIIWAYGMMTSGVNTIIPEVIADLGGADSNYYCVQLTQNSAGGNGHPYYTGHATMATELTAFIKGLQGSTFTPGNVDGDSEGDVSLADVSALAQYVAEWDLVEGADYAYDALDPNGDGEVNLNDVSLLAQYVAEWDVTLSQKPYTPAE